MHNREHDMLWVLMTISLTSKVKRCMLQQARGCTAQHSKTQLGTAQHKHTSYQLDKRGQAMSVVTCLGQHSTAQHSTAQHSTAQHSTIERSTTQHSKTQLRTAQHEHAANP